MNTAINLSVETLVGFGALLLAALALIGLARLERQSKRPGITAILEALRPYAIEAIYAAEAKALKALQDGEAALSGVDKKALADKFYALLPGTIHVGVIIIPIGLVKALISQAQWEALVQQVFDQADTKIAANEAWLQKQVQALVAHNGVG